ncbi:MAG: serine hydrolase [Bradyrhizobium sp.]
MPSSDIERSIEEACGCLVSKVVDSNDPYPCRSLQERMAAEHVPGVSIAVIHGGVIAWARGFGVARPGGEPVTAETMFQAGSISKPVAAMAALRVVEQGGLSLDADVNQALISWKIPASTAAPSAVVTLRELLTHTAGLSVHGFPGYSAGVPAPTLVQVLDGASPANTAAVRLEAVPGAQWKYSGGGYTVMQQLLIDVTRRPFAELLRDTVLVPAGMTRSTYQQPLPIELHAGVASPYQADGSPVPGGAHVYPELAAAGLWTTPTDLARLVIAIQRGLRGEPSCVLSQEMIRQMLVAGTGGYGLGWQVGGAPDQPFFAHGGVNEGFESSLAAYQRIGEGVVVMTNAQGGQILANEIVRAVAKVHGWPDFRPIVRTSIQVDPAILSAYAGVYELTPAFSITVTLEDGRLMAQGTRQRKAPLFAESNTRFFLKATDAVLDFVAAETGQALHLILHQNGQDMTGVRKP